MNLKDLIKLLKEVKSDIDKHINMRNSNEPPMLRTKFTHGNIYYYVKAEDGTWTYLPKSDMEKVKSLAQSTYERKITECAKDEMENLDRCIDILERTEDVNLVYDNLKPEMKELVVRSAPNDLYAKNWQNTKFIRYIEQPDGEFKTDRGEYVRSKTEFIIANKLFALGIPFHYEKPIKVDKYEYLYPDFTILNVRTREVYIWEHFGKMDDDEYRRKNLAKIEKYSKVGYLFGKNLIATFESSTKPLSTELIDKMIREFFL